RAGTSRSWPRPRAAASRSACPTTGTGSTRRTGTGCSARTSPPSGTGPGWGCSSPASSCRPTAAPATSARPPAGGRRSGSCSRFLRPHPLIPTPKGGGDTAPSHVGKGLGVRLLTAGYSPMSQRTPTATVLVVDDEPIIRANLAEFLQSEGFAVRACASGEEALERAAADKFDVALCDVRLPGLDGLDVLERLARISPETFVLRITAYATVESAGAA